jgi:predicted Ser/Thr protein kinase
MATLVHVLQSFRSGSLSKDSLIAAVDQILAGERVNEAWLLETLKEENTKVPLPADVHEQVLARIEQAAQKKTTPPVEPAPATPAINDASADDDASCTRLATSLFGNESQPSQPRPSQPAPDSAETAVVAADAFEPVAMKGTGDVLNDRFVLEECIGAGGMSTVYKALDRRKLEADDRNPYVAVKVLNVEFRSHPDSLIALQREAKKSQSLAHPNIVRVYDFDRDGATVYMTMEYLAGKSLAKVLRAPGFQGLEEAEALHILEDVARALIFAHENGIVHSDFKPANIILTENGKVKVIDFGIARAFQRPDDSDAEATRFDPGSLGALTPTYASPEMLEHGEPDPRDDVYALACISYEMLTGRHPYGRMQATEARDGGLELKRRQLSRRQWKALKSALAFDRDKRTPTVREFLAAMRPDQTLALASVVSVVGKAAAIAGVGILGYLAVSSGVLDNLRSEGELAVAQDNGDSDEGVELASLQTDRMQVVQPAELPKQPQPAQVALATQRNDTKAGSTPSGGKVAKSPAASAQSLEAGVAAVLDKLSCAAVNASVKKGTVNLRGYVSAKLDVAGLEKDLLGLPGARQVTSSLKPVDDGKCAVVELFAPYMAIRQEAGSNASIKVRGENNELTEGDPLVVDISTPARQSFVNVDYFSLDGGVVHMLPGPRASDNLAPPNYKATLGDLGEWTIAKPFGTEMVTVIMTPKPLFDTARDEYEKNEDYVAAVKKRLEQISRESGKDSVAVDFVMINTKPKSLLQQLRDTVPLGDS